MEHGAMLAISTEPHGVAELGFMPWGVDQARRGWVTAAAMKRSSPPAHPGFSPIIEDWFP
jgi:histidinol phosphatase-like PHP family hydrolase